MMCVERVQVTLKKADIHAQSLMCCLCGGGRPAEEPEHAPPRILFIGKRRPDGLVVPACKRCNRTSAQHDQVVAAFSIGMSPKMVRDQDPEYQEAFKKAFSGATSQKGNKKDILKLFNGAGGVPVARSSGLIQPMFAVSLDDGIFRKIFDPWAVKQALAIWYDEIGNIFSEKGAVGIQWFTPHEIQGRPDIIRMAASLQIKATLKQGKWEVPQQFSYMHTISANENVGILYVYLHDALSFFAFVIDREDHFRESLLRRQTRSIYRVSANRGIVRYPNRRTI